MLLKSFMQVSDVIAGPDQLEPLFIKGIGQQDYPWAPEKHELKILNGLYFGENRAYLFKDAASKLCKLVHGHSYDALLAHPLSEEVLKTNAALYRHAKTVAEYVLHEASKGSPWKKLQVNTASFEFWTLAVVYARHTIASDPKMRILGHIPSHTLWDVARDFWKEFLLRKRQRYLKEDAREKFHVVVIDKIESLRSNVADPLDEDTISVDKLEQLSHRIHGKSANDARKDPVTLLQHNRLRFEMASAGLVEVIDRFDSAALEVLIDVVGITCANHLDEALDSRDRRLGIFLDAYYRSVHIDPRGLCSFSNVSKERARSMADAFLYHLMNSSIWPSACEWTVGKKVFSYLQVDRESIHNIVAPTFIVEWANVCGVTVLSRFDRPPPDAQQCGRLYWTLADPDYLTTDDAAMADTPMEDGPTGDDYMADVMAGWDREHEF